MAVKKPGFWERMMKMAPTVALACSLSATAAAAPLPDPAVDTPLTRQGSQPETVVVSGGCFWGVQNVFQHVKGVTEAISGYAGGKAMQARYDIVSSGNTGHAESVKVTYDPSKVTLGTLLKVFFAVAHNPTELDRQGPDHGTQYRSAIFYANENQKKIADAYIKQLQKASVFADPVVTRLEPLEAFYPAEDYHQNYAKLHPNNTYIVVNDLPKVKELQKLFPELYVE